MRSKSVLDTPRLREMRKKRRNTVWRKLAMISVLFLAIFVLLGFAARLKDVNIQTVSVTGNKLIDAKELEDFTWEILGGHFFWLYPKSNIMIYPDLELKNRIQERFKRIENIEIFSNADLTLSIKIKERGAKYVWCDEYIKCYFTDEYGYIFDEAPYFSGPVYLKFQGGVNLDKTPVGQIVAGPDFEKLTSFTETMKTFGLEATMVNLSKENETEIYLISADETIAPKIVLNRKNDLTRVIENLQTAVQSEPLKTEIADNYKSLLYIDLRFDNKVYYKFK